VPLIVAWIVVVLVLVLRAGRWLRERTGHVRSGDRSSVARMRMPRRTEIESTPWIVERSSPESPRVALRYQTVSGRDIESRLERVDVTELDETVQIALTQTIRYGREANTWVTLSEWVDVELRAPLGRRRLVHAPVAPEFADLVPEAAPPDRAV